MNEMKYKLSPKIDIYDWFEISNPTMFDSIIT